MAIYHQESKDNSGKKAHKFSPGK